MVALIPKNWYWIRRADGSLAPYLFHRLSTNAETGRQQAEFFVGSFIQFFELSQVVGPAEMPTTVDSQAGRGNDA